MNDRVLHPLFDSQALVPARARFLSMTRIDTPVAVALCRKWHSRLPNTQAGPWQYAFGAHFDGTLFAVALWNNPSTRSLPSHWAELRRLARSPDAPRYTCSRFLAWMVRYLRKNAPHHERCISYQDPVVHKGTIYKAAGWTVGHEGGDRVRDRSKPRKGTDRAYRSNMNGVEVDAVGKVRWEIAL